MSQLVMLYASAICLLPSLILAHDGMNMGDMGGMDGMGDATGGGTMKMYLHFTPGDSVLFGPWIAQTSKAVFGTCVGVFLLAMVDRWFSATSAVVNAYWNKR